MSRPVLFFLMVISPGLALVLSCLGFETGQHNLIGWFLVLFGVSYLAGGLIYSWRHKGAAPVVSEEMGDRSFWLILPGFLAVFFGSPLEWIYLPETLPRTTTMQVAGTGLVGMAIALFIWTRVALKEMYTGHVQVSEGHRLVREGPYHYLRHPGYAGFVLMAFGLSIGFSSLIGLLAIPLLLVPALVYRMGVEEKLLAEQFGEVYRVYARSTSRLIPGLY